MKSYLFLIIIFLASFSFAQEVNFEQITNRKGLSQNDVLDICQDSDGFIWLGTNDGLNRYDGNEFKVYREGKNQLSSAIISEIIEDNNKNLWVATFNKGLNRLNLLTGEIEQFVDGSSEQITLCLSAIRDIKSDSKGNVWGASRFGFFRISNENGRYKIHEVPNDLEQLEGRFFKLFIDEQDQVWAITERHLLLYEDGMFKVVKELLENALKEMLQFDGKYVVSDNKGIFFASYKQLLNPKFKPKYFDRQGSTLMMIASDSVLWKATQYGVSRFHYDRQTKKFVKDKKFQEQIKGTLIRKTKIRRIYEDKNGLMFFGTNGKGLLKYNPTPKRFQHYRLSSGSENHKVRAIYEDREGNLLVGFENSLLRKMASNQGNDYVNGFKEYANSVYPPYGDGEAIYSICEVKLPDGDNVLIGGSLYKSGIISLDESRFDVPEVKSLVFCIVQSPDGLLWIGTYANGLYRYDPSGKIPTGHFLGSGRSGLLSDVIRSFEIDVYGNLWIGTSKGLNVLLKDKLDDENPTFIQFVKNENDPLSLSNNYILPVYESSVGDIWVGTLGGGLNRLIKYDARGNAEFEHFSIEDGLPNNVIKSILEDDYGNIWVATNKGLSRIDVSSKKIVNFDVNDGLQDNEFSDLAAIKRRNGDLIFGGVNGVNIFRAKEIQADSSRAIPVFTSLSVLNESMDVGKELNNRIVLKKDINYIDNLTLKYKENSFSIGIASLNFLLPAKNYCRYRLVGFDEGWIKKLANNAEIKYTNLKPGKYRLELMAANSDGVWSEAVKTIDVIIQPPFYLTLVAKLLYAFIFISLLLFFRNYTIIGANRKNELVINELKKEKEQEIVQAKLKFFTNISHEFKTPLTLIINPLTELLKKETLPPENVVRDFLSIIHRNANVLLRLINQLLEFRKLEQGKLELKVKEDSISDFIHNVYKSFEPLAEAKNIEFNFSSRVFEPSMYFDPDKLEKVMYNLISNAIKYTKPGGKVNVDIIDDNSAFITIIVADNGIGISRNSQERIFERFYRESHLTDGSGTGIGLAYTRSLIDVMKGEIELKSVKGEGTSFFVRLPKDKNTFEIHEFMNDEERCSSLANNLLINEGPVGSRQLVDKSISSDEKCTILIVEDNDDLRNYLQSFFSVQYEVLVASNGLEGTQLVMEHIPDIVISDVSMPERDGLELTRIIKDSFETSHIPVILLTAQSTDEQKQQGFVGGADMYVNKPFNSETLMTQVESLLKNRQRLRAKYREKIMVSPSELTPSNNDEKFVHQLLELVEEHMDDPNFSVQMMATEIGMSQTTLNKKLTAITGQKAKVFIRSIRLKRAAQLLKQGELSVSEITYSVGFNDLQYFRKCFVAEFGCLPSEYKKDEE